MSEVSELMGEGPSGNMPSLVDLGVPVAWELRRGWLEQGEGSAAPGPTSDLPVLQSLPILLGGYVPK